MNSPSVSDQDTRFKGQSDLIHENMRNVGINIIGIGSVGSHVAYTLAQSGFKHIRAFDHDVVEEHNISNQFFKHTSVGQTKAYALKTTLYEMLGVGIHVIPEKYKDQNILSGIVILAVDSIQARENIWYGLDRRPGMELLIDVRMGLESLERYVINPRVDEDVAFYENRLDPDVTEAPCTAKTTAYTVNYAAGFACQAVIRHVRGEKIDRYNVADLKNLTFIAPKEATQ